MGWCRRIRMFSLAPKIQLTAVFLLSLFGGSARAQGLLLTESIRWELPAKLIPEYMVDADELGLIVGQRGTAEFWIVRPDGAVRRVDIRCEVRPWFVGGRGVIVGVDSASRKLAEIDATGRCVRLQSVVPRLAVIRDIAVTTRGIDVLSSNRGVRPDSIAIQRYGRDDFRQQKVEVVVLPASISRPMLDDGWSGWQVVDRQFPFLYLPVDSLSLPVRRSQPELQAEIGQLGHAVDSLWVALPTVRVDAGRFLRTLVDLRGDSRLVVQRDCIGLLLRLTRLDDAIGIVMFQEASQTLLAVRRAAMPAIIGYNVEKPPASASCAFDKR